MPIDWKDVVVQAALNVSPKVLEQIVAPLAVAYVNSVNALGTEETHRRIIAGWNEFVRTLRYGPGTVA